MNKMMIVGCPGSGKSTLSKILAKKLNIPVLHLDYIYHIDNFKQISRSELKDMVEIFVKNNESFIIDGNYGSTMEWRMQFVDTVILMDIDTDICVANVLMRMNDVNRDDMAPGFDNSIMDDDFLEFVKNFKIDKLPSIKKLLNRSNIKQIIIEDYEQLNQFLDSL